MAGAVGKGFARRDAMTSTMLGLVTGTLDYDDAVCEIERILATPEMTSAERADIAQETRREAQQIESTLALLRRRPRPYISEQTIRDLEQCAESLRGAASLITSSRRRDLESAAKWFLLAWRRTGYPETYYSEGRMVLTFHDLLRRVDISLSRSRARGLLRAARGDIERRNGKPFAVSQTFLSCRVPAIPEIDQ